MPQQDNVECEYEAEGVTNYYQCNTVVSIIANHQISNSCACAEKENQIASIEGGGNQALPESIHFGGRGGRGVVPLF